MSATATSTEELSTLYALPFTEARAVAGENIRIEASVKLHYGTLSCNRYVILFDRRFLGGLMPRMLDICSRLSMPAAAWAAARAEIARRAWAALGVAWDGGVPTYKLYLDFGLSGRLPLRAGTLLPISGAPLIAIEWRPGEHGFRLKEYEWHTRVTTLAARRLVLRALYTVPPLGQGSGVDRTQLLEDAFCLLEGTSYQDNVLVVTERSQAQPGTRCSIDFRLSHFEAAARARQLVLSSVAPRLSRLAATLSVPRQEFAAWLRQAGNDSLTYLGIGQAADGNPFVTLYHGWHARPPPLPFHVSPQQ